MRTVGEAQFRVDRLRERSVVTRLQHRSPLRLFAPRRADPASVPWLISTSLGGGLVDGDRLRTDGVVGDRATVFVGTQSATKVYRGGAIQETEARIGDGGLLAMISDPVICFADATYRQEQRFALAGEASLLVVDGLVAGRLHHGEGEAWRFTGYESSLVVERDGQPLLIDTTRLAVEDGELAARLGRMTALATLLAIGPRVAALGEVWRTVAPNRRGAEVLVAYGAPKPGVHLVRVAAARRELLEHTVRRLLDLRHLLGEDPLLRRY